MTKAISVGTVIRDEFRANSATTGDAESLTTWPLAQSGSQTGLDADGDLVITYSGYGPDIAQLSGSEQDVDSVLEDILFQAYKNGASDENDCPDPRRILPVGRAGSRRGQRRDVLLVGRRSATKPAECHDE